MDNLLLESLTLLCIGGVRLSSSLPSLSERSGLIRTGVASLSFCCDGGASNPCSASCLLLLDASLTYAEV